MKNITLADIVQQIDLLPDLATIYATQIDGAWQTGCWAIATTQPASTLPPIERCCLDYFMDVWAAKEALARAQACLRPDHQPLSTEQKLHVLTGYAQSLAYCMEN